MKITIQDLCKTYSGGVQALKDVSLEIGTGMFGLLGPNGAGKTTLLRIMATLLKPTSGQAKVDGFDVTDRHQKWAVKQILGYLPQELGLYPNLTVIEFLDYISVLKNLHDPRVRAEEVAKRLSMAGLKTVTHQRIGTLSGGMKRRVGIAQALLGDPHLLIVDEPTAGLDPEERVRFRTMLAHMSTDRIVLLSTHIVEDIATTCRDMAVLNEGKVIFQGTPSALISAAVGKVWEVTLPEGEMPEPTWQVASRIQNDEGMTLRVVGPRPNEAAQVTTPTLEEAYLDLMAKD